MLARGRPLCPPRVVLVSRMAGHWAVRVLTGTRLLTCDANTCRELDDDDLELSPLESPRATPAAAATPYSTVRTADTSLYYTAEKAPVLGNAAAHTPERLFPSRYAFACRALSISALYPTPRALSARDLSRPSEEGCHVARADARGYAVAAMLGML